MNIQFYDINDLNKPNVVVIYANYNDKIVMCKHDKIETWEIPGGHIEKGEIPETAAKRELYEETGAIEFNLVPFCKYSFEINGKTIFSIMYKAEITKMENLPNFEIKQVGFFEKMPTNVTYPEIYAEIFKKVR